MACVISGIFETLRLATLYSISKFDGFYRGLSLVLYTMTAFVCFSAGAISFNSNVIERSNTRHIEIAKSQSNDIFLIKNEFSKRIDEKIEKVKKHKRNLELTLERFPNSSTTQRNISKYEQDLVEFENERIEFFRSIENGSTDTWISDQKAKLGLAQISDVYNSEMSPISKAAFELYGIDDIKLQKYTGVILTFSIEMSIIILAILGLNIKNEEEIKEEIVEENPEIKKKEKKDKKSISKIKNKEAVPLFFE